MSVPGRLAIAFQPSSAAGLILLAVCMVASARGGRAVPAGGRISFQGFGDHAIVPWQSVRYFIHCGKATFQLVLYANGDFGFRYGSITGPTDEPTIGWQHDAANGATIAYDEDHVAMDRTVAIDRPWLTVFRDHYHKEEELCPEPFLQ